MQPARDNMSLYAEYLKERTNDEIIEIDDGFCTYRYIDALTVYIVDIYIKPEARQFGHASKLADVVAEIARKKGCKCMVGTVQPSAKGSTISLQVLLGYGMSLVSSTADGIVMRKEI